MSSRAYQRLEFDLPASAEACLVGELWAGGTLGLESRETAPGELRIVAYFAHRGQATECAERCERLGPAVELRSVRRLPESDWLAEYRRHARPIPLGRRFLVDPGEPAAGRAPRVEPPRRLLRLPARRAFGTGEHPSTRLVVEWLEDLDLDGLSVLDVGCGSGILSLVAVLEGAASVTAIEVDPIAAFVARDGQRLNRVSFPLVAGRAACLRSPAAGEGFDLALVNVLPETIRPDLAVVRSLVAPRGQAIFSGLPSDTAAEIERRLAAHGLLAVERRGGDGWTALLTRAAAAPAARAQGGAR